MEQTELERVAEAILFAAGEPVELERIAMALNATRTRPSRPCVR